MRALRWRRPWPSAWLLPALLAVLLLASRLLRGHQEEPRDLRPADEPPDRAIGLEFLADQASALREFVARQPDVGSGDRVGPRRALPDTRAPECLGRRSVALDEPAAVSVIVVFHNEPRALLARTLLSLLERTPWRHLHEILLLDDASDDEDLLPHLEQALEATTGPRLRLGTGPGPGPRPPPLRLHRNARRHGLIASRNLGAALASGRLLLFLDSHCEANVGWLEPLLERVRGGGEESRLAVSPVLDRIDAQTLEYRASASDLRGGFDWNLHFHWVQRRRSGGHNTESAEKEDGEQGQEDRYRDREQDEDERSKPFKSPAFAGGIFMISRNWFLKLNGFNPLLEIWGGESIEMSIKLWLCGGRIEIVPCSRVGHVFRPRHPFDFPEDEDEGRTTYLRNAKVIAESWLDEFKYFFYASKPSARSLPMPAGLGQDGQLDRLKARLQCRPFAWYLRHVFPELRSPHDESAAFGQLSSGGRCLRIRRRHDGDGDTDADVDDVVARPSPPSARLELHLGSCFDAGVTRWQLGRRTGQLQSSSGACLNVVPAPTSSPGASTADPSARLVVALQYCRSAGASSSHRWLRRGARLVHAQWRLCLDNPRGDVVAVSRCRRVAPSQLFRFSVELETGP